MKRILYCLISIALAAGLTPPVRAQGPATTAIIDVVYRADSTPAGGTLFITWPAFETAEGNAVAAGSKSVSLGPGGTLNVSLVPNEGATPPGSFYRVVYQLDDDSTQIAWSGEYEVWSDILPGFTAADVLPGDAVTVDVPSQAASFSAIVREVDVEVADFVNDRCRYRIAFTNDAAAPLALALEDSALRDLPEDPLTVSTAGTTFIADLPDAEITTITSTTVTIDAGVAAPAGGGFEVRRSDFGWGPENDRNLVGRFTAQSFTVTRVTRVVGFFVRQFDNSSPPRYSRYSTALHVDYPL